jgi:hypothetical protein
MPTPEAYRGDQPEMAERMMQRGLTGPLTGAARNLSGGPSAPRPISEEVTGLNSAIEDLHRAVEALEEKISPVLSPDVPTGKEVGRGGGVGGSVLVQALSALTGKVIGIITKIGNIHSRIEL